MEREHEDLRLTGMFEPTDRGMEETSLVKFGVLGRAMAVFTDAPGLVRRAVEAQFGAPAMVERAAAPPSDGLLILLRGGDGAAGMRERFGSGHEVNFDGLKLEAGPGWEWMLAEAVGDDGEAVRVVMRSVAVFARAALMREGVYFFHAGAAGTGDSAAVFAGVNDTGKSSLVRFFLERGWEFIADDNLPASVSSGRAVVHFTCEAVNFGRLSAPALTRMESLGFVPAAFPSFYRAAAAESRGERVGRTAAPRAIFFLEASGGGERVESVDHPAAAALLMGLTRSPVTRGHYAACMDLACGLVSGSRCFRVRWDPSGAAAPALGEIERLAEECAR
ncbi:MAG: hypothetical protein AB1742_10535 [bacterium]